jgi:Na+-driven multidrug efflux pump
MDNTDRPRLNAIAGPILGEFLLGYTVVIVGLWLASHTSDGAAGSLGLANQVLETLFVLYRVLAIGMGVVITQLLGGQQTESVRRTALAGLGAASWAGMFVFGWLVLRQRSDPRRAERAGGNPADGRTLPAVAGARCAA